MFALSRVRTVISLCFLALITFAMFTFAGCTPDAQLDRLLHNKDLALQHTDEFSWKVLAQIVRPVNIPIQQAIVKGQNVNLYSTLWETWAEDEDIFVTKPDPSNPPRWELRNKHGKVHKNLFNDPLDLEDVGQDILRLVKRDAKPLLLPFPRNGCNPTNSLCLEVRHNRRDFESIVKSSLWYQEGLRRAYDANADENGIPKNEDMDKGSIEIKAGWRPWKQGDDLSRYHIYQDQNGNVFELVALHIMTKALDKWTWSTFEQVDNKARCDYYGCNDNYGSTEPHIQKNATINQSYPVDALSDASSRDLRGLPDEWKYYRLKGSQIEYTYQGQATLLGNSELERQVHKDTASCISCHARARINSDGVPATDRGYAPRPTTGPTGLPHSLDPCRPVGFIWSVALAQPAYSAMVGNGSSSALASMKPRPPAPLCDLQ